MKRLDVLEFSFNLENNVFQLHQELKTRIYTHSDYTPFYITDPKLRNIHKATVRDRVVHQAVFRILYYIFDKRFIFDSYSCRFNKGTHKGVERLETFIRKLSQNNSQVIFVLKCDVKKFFDSVDQKILLEIIKRRIYDKNCIWLVEKILRSFERESGKGLPLGNVTSQLFANVYLNELDQFVKHKLKAKYYLRYCDDFIILGEGKEGLAEIMIRLEDFLNKHLKLSIHKNKIVIRKHTQGIDFLGYVVLPHHRVLRTRTKKRIFKKISRREIELSRNTISEETFSQSIQSFLGVLKHCRGYKLEKQIKAKFI